MLLSFKEQIIEDFLIPSFILNEGEIVILEIPNGVEFQKISLRLIEIITELCSEIKYVEHFKENSFLNKLFPTTIGQYLKKCDRNSTYKNKIYEIEWMKPQIKINSIAGVYRRLLSLYKTLTFTKNIIIDLVGVDPIGGVEIYKILKQNQKENGSAILFDSCNEFEKDCTNFIRAKYAGTNERYKNYNEIMVDKLITERIPATTTDLRNRLKVKVGFVFVMIWQIRRIELIYFKSAIVLERYKQ